MKKILIMVVLVCHSQLFLGQLEIRDSVKRTDDWFLNENRNALKFDVSSFLVDVTSLTYEHCIKKGKCIEGTLGIIGAGIPVDGHENPGGFLFRGGYKLILDLFPSAKVRYRHILKGFYIKFEFDYANYSVYSHKELFSAPEKYRISKFALMTAFGYQLVLNDTFIVNPYIAGGMGRNNLEKFDWSYPYGFSILGSLASSVGIRAGLLF